MGNVALFAHSHLRVAFWRPLDRTIVEARPSKLLLNTASLSISLLRTRIRVDQRPLNCGNPRHWKDFAVAETTAHWTGAAPVHEKAIQRWENEGGNFLSPLMVRKEKNLMKKTSSYATGLHRSPEQIAVGAEMQSA